MTDNPNAILNWSDNKTNLTQYIIPIHGGFVVVVLEWSDNGGQT